MTTRHIRRLTRRIVRGCHIRRMHVPSLSSSAATLSQRATSLIDTAHRVFSSDDIAYKIDVTQRAHDAYLLGEIPFTDDYERPPLPLHPCRPARPLLLPTPPSSRASGQPLHIHLLHTLAHIELNAIELYWDTLARFTQAEQMPDEFIGDIMSIINDESRHLQLVLKRLQQHGKDYGCVPAHSLLWSNAVTTQDDLVARIALVPLVQEARGLDAGPKFVAQLTGAGDVDSANVVQRIVDEEVRHVRIGMKWFKWLCSRQQVDPLQHFHHLLDKYNVLLNVPINAIARAAADMHIEWYEPSIHQKHKQNGTQHNTARDVTENDNKKSSKTYRQNAAAEYSVLKNNGIRPTSNVAASLSRSFATSSQSKRSRVPASSTEETITSTTTFSSETPSDTPPSIVFIFSVWPERRSSAAGVRSWSLMQICKEAGYRVTAMSAARITSYVKELNDNGIQTSPTQTNHSSFDTQIQQINPRIIVFDTFIEEEIYGWRCHHVLPNSIRVLDTQDFHSLRRYRQTIAMQTDPSECEYIDTQIILPNISSLLSSNSTSSILTRELAAIHRCDLTLVVSTYEYHLLTTSFHISACKLCLSTFYYPLTHYENKLHQYDDRVDFVSVGNFRHLPNVDSFYWLHSRLWPLIHQQLPLAQCHIYGTYATQQHVMDLHAPDMNFHIMGPTKDVYKTLSQYSVLLAPLRYGAGIKGKIADAWSVGTPVVTTSIGAEGMTSKDTATSAPINTNATATSSFGGLIADNVNTFVNAAITLYNNQNIWQNTHKSAINLCQILYNYTLNGTELLKTFANLAENIHQQRSVDFIQAILLDDKHRSTEAFARNIEWKRKYQSLLAETSPATSSSSSAATTTTTTTSATGNEDCTSSDEARVDKTNDDAMAQTRIRVQRRMQTTVLPTILPAPTLQSIETQSLPTLPTINSSTRSEEQITDRKKTFVMTTAGTDSIRGNNFNLASIDLQSPIEDEATATEWTFTGDIDTVTQDDGDSDISDNDDEEPVTTDENNRAESLDNEERSQTYQRSIRSDSYQTHKFEPSKPTFTIVTK